MADPDPHERKKIIAIVIGLLLLGGIVGGIVALLVSDNGSDDSTAPVTTTSRGSDAPPCTTAAILTALKAQDSTITSVGDFSCGSGWAGASYSNPNFDGAALLKAQGSTWVAVDRAADCNDPSIPTDVHHYCEVS